jgi:hypothetical protein
VPKAIPVIVDLLALQDLQAYKVNVDYKALRVLPALLVQKEI